MWNNRRACAFFCFVCLYLSKRPECVEGCVLQLHQVYVAFATSPLILV